MSGVINIINNWMFCFYMAILGIGMNIANEIKRIKDDERGIEIVQVIIILLIVIVIAVMVWVFLGDLIAEWFGKIGNQSEQLPG